MQANWMHVQVVDGMRPFLLPVFFYAGQVNAAAETPGLSDSQTVALTELRALLLWSLLQLHILSDAQVPVLQTHHRLYMGRILQTSKPDPSIQKSPSCGKSAHDERTLCSPGLCKDEHVMCSWSLQPAHVQSCWSRGMKQLTSWCRPRCSLPSCQCTSRRRRPTVTPALQASRT